MFLNTHKNNPVFKTITVSTQTRRFQKLVNTISNTNIKLHEPIDDYSTVVINDHVALRDRDHKPLVVKLQSVKHLHLQQIYHNLPQVFCHS